MCDETHKRQSFLSLSSNHVKKIENKKQRKAQHSCNLIKPPHPPTQKSEEGDEILKAITLFPKMEKEPVTSIQL